MSTKSQYRSIIRRAKALFKKADIAEDLRYEGSRNMVYYEQGQDPKEFRVFHGLEKGKDIPQHEKHGVQVGSFWIPTLFFEFIKIANKNMPELAKYPPSEAYKYVLDKALVADPRKQEAADKFRKNLVEAKRTYEEGLNVQHRDFQEARLDLVEGNPNLPLIAKYLSMKPRLLLEWKKNRQKSMVPGLAKSQSRIIRKKISSIARANKNNRRTKNG